jgi:hypothetical protein
MAIDITAEATRILAAQARTNQPASNPIPAHQDTLNPEPDSLGLSKEDTDAYLLDMAFNKPIQARLYPATMDKAWAASPDMVNLIHFGEKLLAICTNVNKATVEGVQEFLVNAGVTLPEECTWGQEDPAVMLPGQAANTEYPVTYRKVSRHNMAALAIGQMALGYARFALDGKLSRDLADTTPAVKLVNASYTAATPRIAKKTRGSK